MLLLSLFSFSYSIVAYVKFYQKYKLPCERSIFLAYFVDNNDLKIVYLSAF